MKITLFFCAGNLAETLGIHRISEMNGVGRRMPWTMAAFTVGALGMIGVPPMAGFVSKWYLGIGGVEAGQGWVIAVLAASSVLNAAYFLPILHTAWFKEPAGEWEEGHPGGRFEADWRLLLPSLATAALVIATGVFASTIFSPLTWAKLIAAREYQP
jgi:multicomponent Na+:H+ antiporter subunit D